MERILETMHQDVFLKYLRVAETPVAIKAEYIAGDHYTKGSVYFSFFAQDEGGRVLVRLRVPFGFANVSSYITVDGEKIPWKEAVRRGAAIRDIENVRGFHEELWCVVTFVVETIKERVTEFIRGARLDVEFLEDSAWEWSCGGARK